MKNSIFILFFSVLSLSIPALAESSLVALGTSQALQDFAAANADTPQSLLAFSTVSNAQETSTTLHYQDREQGLAASQYNCHFHGENETAHAHCSAQELGRLQESSPAPAFTVSQFSDSLNYALDIFARKIGSISTLTAIKMWQVDDEIQVTLGAIADSSVQESYFMCHLHGDHFDCHRSRSPGPQEPAF